ncbi:hypothetical protein K440DRAFT_248215 [Wilcoxina mikolae CBS 423.85]|nr:hypothetical protein K440DRAFT_248215 [Wilcoxina mikolae CBS 423.85]
MAKDFDQAKITRRELTPYNFATWSSSGGCTGMAVFYPQIYFNKYYWDATNDFDMSSFQIIAGNIVAGQRTIQLQHYPPHTQACTPIGHKVNGGPGSCISGLPVFTCFRVENWS